MKRITKQELMAGLQKMGIGEGDILVIAADLGEIGLVEGSPQDTILNALLETVGESGTIVGPCFTRHFFMHEIDKKYVFDIHKPPTSGSLSRIMLEHPKSERSLHPTNSFVAIGAKAKQILAGHDKNSLSYDPVGKAVDLNAKMLLIGCVASSPGFFTVHYAQQALGLTHKRFLKPKRGVYYKDNNGEVKLFIKKDFGGCAKGCYKFYSYYVMDGGLTTGRMGNANCIAMDGKRAFDVAYNILKENPRFALCDDPLCGSCRASWSFNKRDYIPYYLRKIFTGGTKKH